MVCFFIPLFALAQPPQANGKVLNLNSEDRGMYNFRLTASIDDLLVDSDDKYDPITINQLRMLKEEAQPSWHPDDVDPYQLRRVAQKALTIEVGRAFSKRINGSELRPTYRAALRTYHSIQERFRYSIQDNGDAITFSRKNKGKKLLELNLDLNLKRGLDPQILIGDFMRFRYDYVYKRAMLEYGFDF
ncbi:MAG: hypothetical protein ACOX2O_10750 [Bdellovibrionota bacterium]